MNKRIAPISFIQCAAILIVYLFAQTVYAQEPTITVGSVYGPAGNPVDLPVYFTAGGTGVVSLQFDLTMPADLRSLDPPVIVAGSAAMAADKITWGSILPSGRLRVLIFGLNQKPLGDGILATIRLNVTGETVPKVLPVGITEILAADAEAVNVPAAGIAGMVMTNERFFWQRAPQQARPPRR